MNKVRFWKLAGSEISLSFTWDPFYLGPLKKIINLSEPPAPSLLPPVMSNPIKILENLIPPLQGFPQVLCSEHGGGLTSIHGGSKGGLKMLSKIPVKEFI